MSQSDQSQKDSEDRSSRASLGDGRPTEERRREQRKLRNYLLDKRFQLKYTGIVIGITALLSAVLGYYLHREIVVSQNTILARNLAADVHIIEPGDIAKRNAVSVQLDEEFNEALRTKLAVVVKINNAPAGTTAELYQASFEEEAGKASVTLVVALSIFLLVLAVTWVYLTHRIAGPIFKFKLLFSKITGRSIRIASRLRKGDELQDAFLEFEKMIDRLRDDRRTRAKKLAEIAESLEDDGDVEAAAARIREVHQGLLESVKD